MSTNHPPFPSPLATHFQHDPSVCFLNHGSFGACPTAVLQAQTRLRNRLEAEPIRFFVEDLWGLMDSARKALGAFVHARPEDIAPVPNATVAVATVIHNLLRQGVIVRPVANYGLPEFLRVTVGLPAENRRFLDALAIALTR